ncbi:dUTP diphosphatase [Jatrophihabitans telluris]|uniref:Deoxyuridine 5'-triphosphate nucleotidohydrolase n=1 Tax=Jatrophihabitans telluris TaxID=2038343 RepID=A0ABY4QV02_9ACTN|nr:dUTP diphosphatase [Jatrophihabitans telluris]UQX86701.1 dUTP diphosphatase [Jatrophihabitans telluris]
MSSAPVTVEVRRLDPGLPVPVYARPGDAGADLQTTVDLILAPGERALVPTGIAVAIPQGYAGFVHPRSGLAIRAGLGLVNAPGTIDSGYRGEIKVIVVNHDRETPIVLKRGDRVAQLVIQRVELARFVEVHALDETERGTGGHGSTGGSELLADGRVPDAERTHAPTDQLSTSTGRGEER